jgi:hypothetical protein
MMRLLDLQRWVSGPVELLPFQLLQSVLFNLLRFESSFAKLAEGFPG